MNADVVAEVILTIATMVLAVSLFVGAMVALVRRSVTVARVVLPRVPAYASRLGLLTIAGGTIALGPAARASVSDPPPATLTLDDAEPVAALTLGGTSKSPPATSAPAPTATPKAPVVPVVPGPPIRVGSYTVVAGDNFWTIAARVVEGGTAPIPPPSTIGPYWRTLITANTDRLVEPNNPSLIFPGQVLVIPEP